MQKKLIALAVAGVASTAAFAQSNVTIYGQLNPSYDIVNIKEANGTKSQTINMNDNASRIGFKGEESLGNGMKAIFNLESYFNITESNSGGVMGEGSFNGGRDTYVGLTGGFGTFTMGARDQVYKKISAGHDLFADSIGDYNTIMSNGLGSRNKKSTWYSTPVLAGFQGHFSYDIEGSKVTGNAVAGNNDTIYSAGATYDIGGLNLLATWVTKHEDYANKGEHAVKFGAKYVFGNKASLAGTWEEVKGLNSSAQNDLDVRRYFVLGSFPVAGNINLIGSYAHAGDNKVVAGDQAAKLYNLGADYNLSKRTKVSAIYSHLKNNTAGGYGWDSGYSPVANGAKGDAYSLRLQHSF